MYILQFPQNVDFINIVSFNFHFGLGNNERPARKAIPLSVGDMSWPPCNQ